jgi:hypothetical protein
MSYDYQNTIRQLQEVHRLVAGGLFGRIAQELQRKRDIRARNILGELLEDPNLPPPVKDYLQGSRQALDKLILRLDRTDALMGLSDAIDFLSNKHASTNEGS